MVIYIKCSIFYATINYQFKASEIKKFREVSEANSSSLQVLLKINGLGMYSFV